MAIKTSVNKLGMTRDYEKISQAEESQGSWREAIKKYGTLIQYKYNNKC